MTDTGTVDRDGFVLPWVREGSGIPMIVVGAQRYYRRVFPRSLRDHFEMVFCDLRQWVPTPDGFDVAQITLDDFCADIDAVRAAAGFECAIVAGHSQHGAIALEYARRYPERVTGVLGVAATPPVGSGEGLESVKDFFLRDAGPERLAAHRRNKATRRVPDAVRTVQDFVDEYVANGALGWFDADFDASPLWEGVEINLDVVYQLFVPEALGGFDVVRLDTPVFLALGRYDYGLPYYLWDEPKKVFSHLRYKLYDKSGHTPPFEQPEEFAADVVAWARTLI